MEKKTIMIVEDDSAINNLLEEILGREGYGVMQAFSGTEARLLLEQKTFVLILLDLMLPGCSGEELMQNIRSKSNVPVIILSAKDEVKSKVQVLRMGADDYMTKPFEPDELLARIEATLRRVHNADRETNAPLCYRDIVLDKDSREISVGERDVELTAIEFSILELLMSNPKKVFTKSNLYRSVWKDEFYGDDNTVNVHISNIRSKLGGDYLQTVWGIGYKMQD